MEDRIITYLELSRIFYGHKFSLYLVGGTVRDFLLNKKLSDMDLVTIAKIDTIKTFGLDIDCKYAHLGIAKIRKNGFTFDVATFRKESNYIDHRHPSKVKFIKSMKKDSKRRDFTINGMYMDDSFKLYDFHGGKKDLEDGIIRFIGRPSKRVKEDPLRILRAIRFALNLGFKIENKTKKALIKYASLLSVLNKEKIKEELKKINTVDLKEKEKLFNEMSINQYIDVIE